LIPGGNHYFRGLAYGGGALWLADQPPHVYAITEVDPRHPHSRRTIRIDYRPGALAWSGAYGDLWITNHDDGKLTRLDAATRTPQTIGSVGINPGPGLVVDGSTVWAGDWSRPHLVRTSAVGPFQPRSASLAGSEPREMPKHLVRLERRRGGGFNLGDDAGSPRALAHQPENERRDPNQPPLRTDRSRGGREQCLGDGARKTMRSVSRLRSS
jgi:hypothetical protein